MGAITKDLKENNEIQIAKHNQLTPEESESNNWW